MNTLKELKSEMMKNPEFVKAYDSMQPEFKKIRETVDIEGKEENNFEIFI